MPSAVLTREEILGGVDTDTKPGTSPVPDVFLRGTQPLRAGNFLLSPADVDRVYELILADTIRELRSRGIRGEHVHIECSDLEKRRLVYNVVAALGKVRPGQRVDITSKLVNRVMLQVHKQVRGILAFLGRNASDVRENYVYCTADVQWSVVVKLVGIVGLKQGWNMR